MKPLNLIKFSYLPLSLALVLSSQITFGKEGVGNSTFQEEIINECVAANSRLCQLKSNSECQEPNLKLSVHEVSMYLNSSWSELYSDGNWFNAKATIQNLKGNPGAIDIKVTAFDGCGTVALFSTSDIGVGHSWITDAISSSYKNYTVYVRASDNSGDYSLKYWDSAA